MAIQCGSYVKAKITEDDIEKSYLGRVVCTYDNVYQVSIVAKGEVLNLSSSDLEEI